MLSTVDNLSSAKLLHCDKKPFCCVCVSLTHFLTQVVSAVDYLYSVNSLHCGIKIFIVSLFHIFIFLLRWSLQWITCTV